MQKNKTGSEPLYKQIKNYLDTLIQQNFNNTEFRFPSENQIATRFHSSRVPVIQALKELENEGKIYRIQGKGSFIQTESSIQDRPELHIGMLLPRLYSKYVSEMIDGAKAYLEQHNIKLYICVTDDESQKEKEFIESIRSMQFQGMLFFPVIHNTYSDAILDLAISKFPTVFIGRNMPRLNISSVFCDPYNQAYHAVEYLLKNERTNIAFISERSDSSPFYEKRMKGYQAAMQHYFHDTNALAAEIDFFREKTPESDKAIEADICSFLDKHPDATSIITTNLAIVQIYKHLIKKQVPPGKYTILVFDSAERMDFIPYQNLIIIDQCPYKIGYLAAEQLHLQITQHATLQNIDVPERFVAHKGNSTDISPITSINIQE